MCSMDLAEAGLHVMIRGNLMYIVETGKHEHGCSLPGGARVY